MTPQDKTTTKRRRKPGADNGVPTNLDLMHKTDALAQYIDQELVRIRQDVARELTPVPAPAPTPLIFSAINKIMAELAPIAKEHRHEDEDFWFRKIDEMMDTLQPLLVDNHVITVPEVLEHNTRENPVLLASGERFVQFFTTVKVRWHLYCAVDGSEFPAPCVTMGESMSELHFSTNAAQTMAYKQMLVQVLFVPVAGQDPEAITGSRSQQSTPAYRMPEANEPHTGNLFDDTFTPPEEPQHEAKREPGKRARVKKEPQTVVAGIQPTLDEQRPAQGAPISSGFISIVRSTLAAKGVDEQSLLVHLGCDSVETMRTDQMDAAMAFINNPSGGAQ